MVQGLAFLSKKSWHTKNLANQEKVWMAEQRKDAEAQKTKELAKQIQQEREQEELDRIAGKKTTMDRGIDWMYQGSAGNKDLEKEDAERKAEEFLLGKEFQGEGAASGDFDEGDNDQGINSVLNSAPPLMNSEGGHSAQAAESALSQEPNVHDRNEEFRMRVEDPMFLVSQKQREKETKHLHTKELYQRVVGYDYSSDKRVDADEHDRKKKRHKKDTKKHKKSKRSSRHRPDLDSRDRKRHRRERSRSRSRSRERYRSRHRAHESSSDDRSRSESSKDYRRRRHEDSRDSHRDYGDGRRRHSHRDRKREDPELHHSHSGMHEIGDGGKRGHRSSDSHYSSKEATVRSGDRPREDPGPVAPKSNKQEGYGLQNAAARLKLDSTDLGPSKELLRKKQSEQEAERRRIRETASRRRTSAEDRERAREEMRLDALRREQAVAEAASRKPDSSTEDRDERRKGNASFLKDITKETHGVSGSGVSLSARVAQNRHTNQKLHDSFL